METVPAEGEPALPLIAGGQVNPQHQSCFSNTSLQDCFRHGLKGGERVADMFKLALGFGLIELSFSWIFFRHSNRLVEMVHEEEGECGQNKEE